MNFNYMYVPYAFQKITRKDLRQVSKERHQTICFCDQNLKKTTFIWNRKKDRVFAFIYIRNQDKVVFTCISYHACIKYQRTLKLRVWWEIYWKLEIRQNQILKPTNITLLVQNANTNFFQRYMNHTNVHDYIFHT